MSTTIELSNHQLKEYDAVLWLVYSQPISQIRLNFIAQQRIVTGYVILIEKKCFVFI